MVTKGFTRSEERCDEGMIVEVTHMKLNHEDGSIVDLLDGLGALNVCVIPALRAVMAVPRAYGEKLIASMGAVRMDNGKNLAPSTKYGLRLMPNTPLLEPDITLQDNLTVTFTDEQLLVRKGDPYLDAQGVTQYNASRVGLTVLSMEESVSKTNMARLGGMFFSSAYLAVNHDKSEFTIASVQKEITEETLVGVDTTNDCIAYLNGTVPGKTVQSSSPQDPEDSGGSASALSTGAIVGIAVGAAAAVVLLAVVAFLLWRRKSRRGNALVAQQQTTLAEAPANSPYIFEKKGDEIHEAPDQRAVLKMSDDERDHAVELDGNAQPSELPGHTQMGPR
ncbi:hypothetical protein G6514_006716 [Epicoccum nigrum]|nr:hypothetical protein G6514_006716 [Epicoccum nigrum]